MIECGRQCRTIARLLIFHDVDAWLSSLLTEWVLLRACVRWPASAPLSLLQIEFWRITGRRPQAQSGARRRFRRLKLPDFHFPAFRAVFGFHARFFDVAGFVEYRSNAVAMPLSV